MALQYGNVSPGTGVAAVCVRSASCDGFVQPFAFFGMYCSEKCACNLPVNASFIGERANISE